MRYSEARSMLGSAFGPGDLAEKINDLAGLGGGNELDEDDGNELMNWMADFLADEDDESTVGELTITADDHIIDHAQIEKERGDG